MNRYLKVCLMGAATFAAGLGGLVFLSEVTPQQPNEEPAAIKIYYRNTRLAVTEGCGEVFPVIRRLPPVNNAISLYEFIFEALVQGPTETEKKSGYYTGLPASVRIKDFRVENEIAYANFWANPEPDRLSACDLEIIRSQIVKTFGQIAPIEEAMINVNGKPQE